MSVNGRISGLCSGRTQGRGKFVIIGNKKQVASDWDPDFLAFWARTTGTPDSWKAAYNQLFVDLKAAGIYYNCDVLYMLAAHNESDARLNLVSSSFTATAHNSPTFYDKLGFMGNAVSAYINTHYRPYYDSVNWQLDNAGFAIYIDTPHTGASYRFASGAYITGSDATWIGATSDAFEAINGTSYVNLAVAPIAGLKSVNINTGSFHVYYNGTNYTATKTPNTITQYPIFLFNLGYGGGADYYPCNMRISAFRAGAAYSLADDAAFETIVENFKTTISSL